MTAVPYRLFLLKAR
jgi:hypothetical protein